MLRLLIELEPFFRNNYIRINVREYARIAKISPPTASKLLSNMQKEGLLKYEKDKNYKYYRADREGSLFAELSRIYWLLQIRRSGLTAYAEKELISPVVLLFGSFSKAEVKKDSDIDLAVFTPSKKTLDLKPFENKLKRKIQIFMFKSRKEAGEELLNNILNGVIIAGRW